MPDSNDESPAMAAIVAGRQFNADVVACDKTQGLLHARGLLPSEWRIPTAERQRIKDASIKIGVVFAPASQMSFVCPSGSAAMRVNVVAIELKAMAACGLTQRESVALILHEIGHVVNRYKPTTESHESASPVLLGEMFADDYARLCGFGDEIISSLEKCAAKNPDDFDATQTWARIKRIRGNVKNSMVH